MASAVFGLIGVLVGGVIASLSAYFMDRRRGWLGARAAGLLTVDDLEVAKAALARADSDLAKAMPAIKNSLRTWETRREALLYRKGTSPSGLTADQWLGVGALFRKLRAVEEHDDPFAEANDVLSGLLAALAVFREDRPFFPQVVKNAIRGR